MPDIILAADVQSALPLLTSAQLIDLPAAISSASDALDRACRRPLALRSFDKVYRPGRKRKIYLDATPVHSIRLRTHMAVAMTVTNTDFLTNQAANTTLSSTALTLWRTASGIPATNVLALSSYQTVADLAAAVNAVGNGWLAMVQGSAGNGTTTIDVGKVGLSELSRDFETQGCLNQTAEVRAYIRDVQRYAVTNTTTFSYVELTESHHEAFRYADRAYSQGYGSILAGSSDPRLANVRATYSGGYAVQPDDMAAGVYPPVPDALKRAAVMAIQGIFDATPDPNVKSESDGVLSYTQAEAPSVLPKAVRDLIAPYIRPRI